MTITFRPAVRQNVPLLIGFAGGTGSGKTMSALRLAVGLSGGKKFCVIDSENGRALHYADTFTFDHADLRAPFTPMAYAEAIRAADKAGYPVIVVDSVSHEHAGDGGLLDWHEAELTRMAGDDWKKRDAMNMAAWIRPKGAHKKFVTALLQINAHVILCFRAEPKVDIVKGPDGKTKIVPKESLVGLNGWIPISEKNLPYELTASFLMVADRPGVPLPIKLQEQHRPFFPAGQLVDEKAGERLAAWSAGAKEQRPAPAPVAEEPPPPYDDDFAQIADTVETVAETIAPPSRFQAPAGVGEERKPTEAMLKKLNVLYGTLPSECEGRITEQQILTAAWRQITGDKTDPVEGVGFSTVRDQLTFEQAKTLIDRLETFASHDRSAREAAAAQQSLA